MKSKAELAAEQAAYWNGPGGTMWLGAYDRIRRGIADFSEVALRAANAQPGERVLDVGCGTGGTTAELAQAVGATGHVQGVDISETLVGAAQAQKLANASFAVGDATTWPFEAGAFDLVFSRFGVMFFADPVLSFRNLRGALRPKGRLIFACWREPRENGWMMAPLMAAYKHVPKLPQLGPEDPGPFSFADEVRVRRILSAAGFTDIEMEACPLTFDVAAGRGLEAAVQGALEIGPASRALEGHPPDVVAAAVQSIRETLTPFAKGQSVLLPGAIWLVTANAP